MKIQNLSIAGLLVVIALSGSPLLAKEQTQVPAYEYGMPLDIAKVIRIEAPTSPMCEVVQAKMTYLNTQGAKKHVSFLQLAEACSKQ
ncbi:MULTISPECIES: DUF2790 domain-containing protein [Pseudomonas]|uniref:DUF2790 domain-containing protein n=1 Tax=Pseudomonas fluorescens TaxID=294 RepID=A0A0N9WP27_PSEFL|nr:MULTISPECIES: DUF2790 domain-containing protein [Pseudomonas]ALI10272.1 hypothetical protein AO356_26820 [Pseudomonas fluorescens]POA12889.1 DUF2790 domain-containing protein [Pseudomonas sp. MPBD7-1]